MKSLVGKIVHVKSLRYSPRKPGYYLITGKKVNKSKSGIETFLKFDRMKPMTLNYFLYRIDAKYFEIID